MALLTTFEGTETQAAPLTISDLFNVNDYFGVKLFGDAWNDVKRAAAIIAQRAVNAPIMFYISSLSNNQAAPGKSSEAGRKLWGYNDAAGVELLGAPCWGAVKHEFDELLGWNPFTTVKNVFKTVRTPFDWTANKVESWKIPIVSDMASIYKSAVGIGDMYSPYDDDAWEKDAYGKIIEWKELEGSMNANEYQRQAMRTNDGAGRLEKTYNFVVEDKGYVTQAQIDAEKEQKKQQELAKMYVDQTDRASKAASEAAKAQKAYEERAAELERTMKQYGAALEPVAQQMATAEQALAKRTRSASAIPCKRP